MVVRRCRTSVHEPLFVRLCADMFASGMLLASSVVDSGAHQGGEACLYAILAPNRTVHAIEPLFDHVLHMQSHYATLPNLKPFHFHPTTRCTRTRLKQRTVGWGGLIRPKR